MTERERFRAVLNFEQVDRIPNVEIGYWEETLTRWLNEGLPADIPIPPQKKDLKYSRYGKGLADYFGLDSHNISYAVNIKDIPVSGYTFEVIDQDDRTKTIRRSDGRIITSMKSNEGIFQELDWPVTNREDWERIRKSISPGWHAISHNCASALPANNRDYPVCIKMPGFFWQMRNWMGFELACTVFHIDRKWAGSILDFWGDYLLAQSELILQHLEPDYVLLNEDVSYNAGPMISPRTAEEFLVPQYRRLTRLYRSYGVDVMGIDSDGMVDELIPVLHKASVNLWMPFEAACRDGKESLLALANKYPWLRIFGGIDKRALFGSAGAIDEELAKCLPLIKRGGYIPTIDHLVPPEVSLSAYMYYLKKKSKLLYIGNQPD